MPRIPQSVAIQSVPGLNRLYQGKVRDTYELPGYNDLLLVVASNRLSIFDFVLPALVRQKGEVLTALNVFWRVKVLSNICDHDLVAYGSDIDSYLPEDLQENIQLQKCATVVRRCEMLPVEAIVRGYLAGSGEKSYGRDGTICGHSLPAGLKSWNRLPYSIFTPTTKAETGHDEHITADSVASEYGVEMERKALQLYEAVRAYAAKRGIIVADTKVEFGFIDDVLILADEVFTPDSSRFLDFLDWQKGKPQSLDKQYVREWGKEKSIPDLDPENESDLELVSAMVVPQEVLDRTAQIYHYIFYRLTGMNLESFQREIMGIDVQKPVRKVEVVVGSESDMDQIEDAVARTERLNSFSFPRVEIHVHVISCHRNPVELMEYARNLSSDTDAIIAGAGMAAALPGVLKAWLCHFGKSDIPVIGLAVDLDNADADEAAILSIEQIPGQPVEMNLHTHEAFFGLNGTIDALEYAIDGEFLPKSIEQRLVRMDMLVVR